MHLFFKHFLILLPLMSVIRAYNYDAEDFYTPIKSSSDVDRFHNRPVLWGGDNVVANKRDIVMNAPYYSYTFENCLERLSEKPNRKKRVIFTIESSRVLTRIAPLFDENHNFVILLLRVIQGPNGIEPLFGTPKELKLLIKNLTIHHSVKFGLGFTSKIQGRQRGGYIDDLFYELNVTRNELRLGDRLVLIEYEIYQLSKTNIDLVSDESLDFRHILLRAESLKSEELGNLSQITMLMHLAPRERWIFDTSDYARVKILGNPGSKGQSHLVLIILLVVFCGS